MRVLKLFWVAVLLLTLSACGGGASHDDDPMGHGDGHGFEPEIAKGSHGGRLLTDGDFQVEIAIFDAGFPPEFRVWVSREGSPVDAEDVTVSVTLTRLGGVQEKISFDPQDDYLRSDTVVYEPHSFEVELVANYQGESYRWAYENLEGRTRITPDLVEAFGIETAEAGPAKIREYLKVYGHVVADPERQSHVMARFDGVIDAVKVSIGDRVKRGQVLAVVESNESLRQFNVTAPISGMIVQRHANAGEQSRDQLLFTIVDTSAVWASLAVFPRDLPRVQRGQRVTVSSADGNVEHAGEIALVNTVAEQNQSVMVRVLLDNTAGDLVPGMYVSGEIEISESEVPLAVHRSGLQTFRDFDVVYAQVGDEFEVRMLELGRQDDRFIEVLGGLDAGVRYVTTNSYVIKADIEKTGATHDH